METLGFHLEEMGWLEAAIQDCDYTDEELNEEILECETIRGYQKQTIVYNIGIGWHVIHPSGRHMFTTDLDDLND